MVWKKGESGNPSGRKTGARDRINNRFLTTLAKHFEENGEDAIERVFREDPSKYVSIVAALQPKESKVDVTDRTDRPISDVELGARIAFVLRQGLEGSANADGSGGDANMGASAGATDPGIH